MPVTEKEFQKDIKSICSFLVGKKDKKNHDKCMNVTMCQFHKCNEELNAFRDARLTEEERNKCHENKKFSEMLKCSSKIMKKKDFHNKHAKLEHCIANKCPEDHKFAEELDEIVKNKFKLKSCEKCDKEEEMRDNAIKNHLKVSNDCKRIHDTEKSQYKCSKKAISQVGKTSSKYLSCRTKYCSSKNNSSITLKNSKQKSKTKKH